MGGDQKNAAKMPPINTIANGIAHIIEAHGENRPGHHGRSRAGINADELPKYRVRFQSRNMTRQLTRARISSSPPGTAVNDISLEPVTRIYSAFGKIAAAEISRALNP